MTIKRKRIEIAEAGTGEILFTWQGPSRNATITETKFEALTAFALTANAFTRLRGLPDVDFATLDLKVSSVRVVEDPTVYFTNIEVWTIERRGLDLIGYRRGQPPRSDDSKRESMRKARSYLARLATREALQGPFKEAAGETIVFQSYAVRRFMGGERHDADAIELRAHAMIAGKPAPGDAITFNKIKPIWSHEASFTATLIAATCAALDVSIEDAYASYHTMAVGSKDMERTCHAAVEISPSATLNAARVAKAPPIGAGGEDDPMHVYTLVMASHETRLALEQVIKARRRH